MNERNVIDYEVRQTLSNGKHSASRDRYSKEHSSWEYCIEGKTLDARHIRVGIGFEVNLKNDELLLIVTVIDLGKSDL